MQAPSSKIFRFLSVILWVAVVAFVLWLYPRVHTDRVAAPAITAPFRLVSSAFADGQPIPVKYTCQGDDINPPLGFSNLPTGTRSLAMVLRDPDAPGGTFIHWTIWNLQPGAVIKEGSLPDSVIEGMTDFHKSGYGGPCSPGGQHTYHFTAYALNGSIGLSSAATNADLQEAMKGKIIGQSELTGTFSGQ